MSVTRLSHYGPDQFFRKLLSQEQLKLVSLNFKQWSILITTTPSQNLTFYLHSSPTYHVSSPSAAHASFPRASFPYVMSEGKLSSLSRLIPTLIGTESFVAWRRAINAYLLNKGSLRVLEGREKEPFQCKINTTIPGNTLVVRPVGNYAGAEMPTDAQREGTVIPAYTAIQCTQRDDWEKKERKARLTIILTVLAGIAFEVKTMWSEAEMYAHICSKHKVNTFERRGNITW